MASTGLLHGATTLSGKFCVVCAAIGFATIKAAVAEAAQITFAPPTQTLVDTMIAADPLYGHRFLVPQVEIKLKGTIEPGDAAKMKEMIGKVPGYEGYIDRRLALLNLDSPGGSFKEAVEIARLIDRRQLPTFIQAGAECLSACAVIFMAGTEQFSEGAEQRSRQIEMPAKLGFHRPFIEEFAADIPPSMLAELPVEEVQTVFTREYLLAFDLANELIQGMLAVDPEAWSNDLLLRMLTAANQLNGGSFVYLTTVRDAIDWNIEVVNLKPPTLVSRLDRFRRAFWLCFNVKWKVDPEGSKGIWPDIEDAHSRLQWSLQYSRGSSRSSPAANDLTFKVMMEGEGMSGCKVMFIKDHERASVEFIGMWQDYRGDFSLLSFEEAIYAYDPTARLEAVSLRRKRRVAGSDDHADTSKLETAMSGRCFVYRNREKVDDEPCKHIDRTDSDSGIIETYVWPSGTRTVVIRKGSKVSINGKAASPTDVGVAGLDFCYFNTVSGNTFCYAAQ